MLSKSVDNSHGTEEIEPYDDVDTGIENLDLNDKGKMNSNTDSADETKQAAEKESSLQPERILYKCTMSTDPYVCIIQNFLDFDEVDQLLSLTQGKFLPSYNGRGSSMDMLKADNPFDHLQLEVSANRTCFSCTLDPSSHPVALRVTQRLAFLAECSESHIECLNILRYLNDIPRGGGGETRFPHLGYRFVPTKGMAIMWRNTLPDGNADLRMMHEALPPVSQVKFAINCFVNKKPTSYSSCNKPETCSICQEFGAA
ncbi:hypothetical protein GUITHDRAFT_140128 [Guillardia theta CCMP2712]|uniref:Prolyl 4-hydroxylase alpha subunit domain-containing protein n=1 Tax=Guillardia theta (strain CCMP2712) TaxID=905079 RepID=L1J626_GUITC|nr:hypothetical protein GUITHDRAFT_140128 [Guillardia theta CCMP2712]EKX43993.1 hypothetical protein GUITHDRAFT_140128 [Guillardia theta CCMP2712]|eukprot:XP_005830973.1 hypothetical protein GUITHDRAFT_140128 [Guillardia theta CCMP2712]